MESVYKGNKFRRKGKQFIITPWRNYLFNNRFWISREILRLIVYTELRKKLFGVTDLGPSFITLSIHYCRMVE